MRNPWSLACVMHSQPKTHIQLNPGDPSHCQGLTGGCRRNSETRTRRKRPWFPCIQRPALPERNPQTEQRQAGLETRIRLGQRAENPAVRPKAAVREPHVYVPSFRPAGSSMPPAGAGGGSAPDRDHSSIAPHPSVLRFGQHSPNQDSDERGIYGCVALFLYSTCRQAAQTSRFETLPKSDLDRHPCLIRGMSNASNPVPFTFDFGTTSHIFAASVSPLFASLA